MIRTSLLTVLLTASFLCVGISAKGRPVNMRVSVDSCWEEVEVHEKHKLPARRHELPMVDYDAGARTLTFVCRSQQRVAYWLKARGSEERTACKELQLVPGTPVEVPLELPAQGAAGWLLYVRVGSVLYVGELE